MYTFFTAGTVRARKPTLALGINGGWLIAAVSTQSMVVLRGVIDVGTAPPAPIQFQVIAMFLIGCMLYLATIPLIFYRPTFVPMSREDLSPPCWINLGGAGDHRAGGLCADPAWLHVLLLGGGELVDTVPLCTDDLAPSVDARPLRR